MLVAALGWDSFRGKYVIGRVKRGQIKPAEQIAVCKKDGSVLRAKVERVYISLGVNKYEVAAGIAGDIVQLSGINEAQIGETIAASESPEALPAMEVEEPTLKIYLGPNTSPFKGLEGDFNTSRQLEVRLKRELETNIGLRVDNDGIGFSVSGRGELHLSVLIETMRREGYEFEVGRPHVVTHVENGITMEPLEEVIIEVPAEHVGTVQMELGNRRAQLKDQFTSPRGVIKLVYAMPTRSFLGMRNELMTKTRGTLIMDSLSMGFQPIGAPLQQLRNGVLIAYESGVSTPYSIQNAEARGIVFIEPAEKVYGGQIIGLNKRREDIEINVTKAKQLTNMRSSSSDGVVQLTPATKLSLEECLNFIEEDELLEVTPKNLRLRKKELDPIKRKRSNRL
jgi:GTP-binding protein